MYKGTVGEVGDLYVGDGVRGGGRMEAAGEVEGPPIDAAHPGYGHRCVKGGVGGLRRWRRFGRCIRCMHTVEWFGVCRWVPVWGLGVGVCIRMAVVVVGRGC